MSANQLVAYNLKRARQAYGWTQEQAAAALEPYIGKRWSKAAVSAAETVTEGKRSRVFDPNEILAFARAFGQSVAYFFTPPDDLEYVRCGDAFDVSRLVRRPELLEATSPPDWDRRIYATRLRGLADELEGKEKR